MKNLTLAFAVATTLFTFGCKKKADGGAGEAMAKMTEFKDEMCKCKDAKCAQDVSDKMTKWSQEQSKNSKEPPKMNEADTKKAQEIGEQMGKCMQTAMSGGGDMTGSAAAGSDTAAPEAGSDTAGSAAPAAGSADGSAAAPAAAGSDTGAAAPAAAGSAAK
jgi:hypothetical protein